MAKNNWIKGLLLALLIIIGGWAVFQLVLNLIKIPFENMGVTNPIYQYLTIIIVVILSLMIGWRTGLKGAVKRLVK